MTTELEGVSGQQHAPTAIYTRERAGTRCTGSWVGSSAGLDGRKSRPTEIRSPECPALSKSLYVSHTILKRGGVDKYSVPNITITSLLRTWIQQKHL